MELFIIIALACLSAAYLSMKVYNQFFAKTDCGCGTCQTESPAIAEIKKRLK